MKTSIRKIFSTAIAGMALTAAASMADAATITFDPLNTTVATGTSLTIDLVGRDFTDGTIGGGFTVAWDPTILTLTSESLTFAGDQLFGQAGVLNAAAGTWTNADVTSFNGVAGPDFDIASLTFTAINNTANPLTSPTDVVIGLFDGGSDRIWADASGLVDTNPTFVGGSVTVDPEVGPVVPVPAAVWLFGSGLLGLAGVARRHTT